MKTEMEWLEPDNGKRTDRRKWRRRDAASEEAQFVGFRFDEIGFFARGEHWKMQR